MYKLATISLALATAFAVTPGFAAQTGNSLDAEVYGNGISSTITLVGDDADLEYRAFGTDQRNFVVMGTCPNGTKPLPVVFVRPGLNLAIPYCE